MAKTAFPTLRCDCGTTIEIAGHRVGDSVACPSCRTLKVILRSKVEGDVPPASGQIAGISDRLPEVQESLKRIKLRRAGHAAKDVALYPTWAILIFGVLLGWYMSAILAGQNLVALGHVERGRRVQTLGSVIYIVVGGIVLAAWYRWGDAMATESFWGVPGLRLAVLIGTPLLGAVLSSLVGREETQAAFEAGARPASPIMVGLVGFLLLVAQFFIFKFVDIASNG